VTDLTESNQGDRFSAAPRNSHDRGRPTGPTEHRRRLSRHRQKGRLRPIRDRLRELASVRFEGMRALAGWSVPSHAGAADGLDPVGNGRPRSPAPVRPDRRRGHLDRAPSRAGYESVCVTSNIYASPVFGFDRFFDRTVSVSPSRRLPAGMDVQRHISDRSTEGMEAYADFIRQALDHDYPLQSLANGVLLKLDDVSRKLPIEKPTDFGGRSITRALEREVTESDGPVQPLPTSWTPTAPTRFAGWTTRFTAFPRRSTRVRSGTRT